MRIYFHILQEKNHHVSTVQLVKSLWWDRHHWMQLTLLILY